MKVIGITGGVGSGKSEVLKFLVQEYGAVVCQMDEVAKQIQRKGTSEEYLGKALKKKEENVEALLADIRAII